MTVMTVTSVFKDLVRKGGLFGLEIEVEGSRLPRMLNNKFWRADADGSLQGNSAEYVLKEPLGLEDLKSAVENLDLCFIRAQSSFNESVRAGVHVHVNCQELTIIQTMTFVTLYLVVEELLVKFCGENRTGNLFCLRCIDAEYLLNSLVQAVKNKNMLVETLSNEDIRYGAINMTSLAKYGSLEFRSMRSTRDFDLIYNWVEILDELFKASLEFKDPKDVIESFSISSKEDFVSKVFKTKYNLIACPELNDFVSRGIRNAQMLAYSSEWDEESWTTKVRSIGGLVFNNFIGEPDDPEEDY